MGGREYQPEVQPKVIPELQIARSYLRAWATTITALSPWRQATDGGTVLPWRSVDSGMPY